MSTSSPLKRRSLIRSVLALSAGLGVVQLGLHSGQAQPSDPIRRAQAPLRLSASGLSFATPLYDVWFEAYGEEQKELRLEYDPGSQTQGVEDLIAESVDFAMSDAGISEQEARQIGRGVLSIPMVAGAQGIAYNIPGVEKDLRLSRRLLSDIYLGRIRAWNDRQIAEINPGVELPPLPITVLYRSEARGDTEILTRFLSAISRSWSDQVGSGPRVAWPVGEPVRPRDDLTRRLSLTLGGITTVGLELTTESPLTLARLENKAGKFVAPTPTAIASGLSQLELSKSLQGFITDPEGEESYPLVAYTWILTYRSYGDPAKVEVLKELLGWCLGQGQVLAAELGYVPMSESVVEKAQAALDSISVPT